MRGNPVVHLWTKALLRLVVGLSWGVGCFFEGSNVVWWWNSYGRAVTSGVELARLQHMSLAAHQALAELAPAAPADTQAQYVPSCRRMETGVQFGFSKEETAADDYEKWCLTDLSVSGTQIITACPVTAIVDTGSCLTAISRRVAETLQAKFPDVSLIAPMGD